MSNRPRDQHRTSDIIGCGIQIESELINRAFALSGERTKEAAVTKALKEFIVRRQRRRLRDLMGKLEWDTAFDYKAERTRG